MVYVKKKQEVYPELKKFYNRPLFRKLALRRYIRTKTSENNMLKEVEKKFGKNILIGLDDWSNNHRKQRKGSKSSLNIGLYKLLSKRFDVVEIGEFRTSIRYNRDISQTMENFKIWKKIKGRWKKAPIHKLLTLKEEPNVVVNRDKNTAINIQRILREYVMNNRHIGRSPHTFGGRPVELTRGITNG